MNIDKMSSTDSQSGVTEWESRAENDASHATTRSEASSE